jgi:uncharacterized protein YjbI with pentapeptide repeats
MASSKDLAKLNEVIRASNQRLMKDADLEGADLQGAHLKDANL